MGEARSYRRLLVTGGAGFIGSCYVRDVLARRDGTEIIVLDKLTYAGNEANLAAVGDDPEQAARFTFVRGDIADAATVGPLVEGVDAVINFAAESHVDRSILDPEAFLSTGVIGVHVLLEACRTAASTPRFLQVSTDEVYGSVEVGESHEDDPLRPRSPYAAAKAAGELLVGSYVVTHGLDAVVTRGSNTYGPFHHPEKLIPLFVTNAIDDLPLPLYGDGLQRRDWLYVGDHVAGVDAVMRRGVAGETYNLPGAAEMTNRETVALLLERLGKPWSLVRHVDDRPGHDRRYAMDGSKAAALGWRPGVAFPDGIAATVDWFVANDAWWRAAKGGDWDAYYERQYGDRLRGGILMRVAVTGVTGRLGSALIVALGDAPFTGPLGPIAWDRTAFDLDDPDGIGARLDHDRPEVVVHAAAWTDVDGCARDPDRALRRNGRATGVLATACATRGIDLLVVSTNEVFGGTRTDGVGYGPADATDPPNPYGASKAAGERAATEAYAAAPSGGRLGIARTAWLFGPPGRDFPHKILDAAERAAAAGEPLRVVGDEWGSPTYAADVADGIVELLAEDANGGTHHLVNGLTATRAAWAQDVISRFGIDVVVEPVPASTWERASSPPRWGVLAPTPMPSGEPLRPWPDAMADYAPTLARTHATAR